MGNTRCLLWYALIRRLAAAANLIVDVAEQPRTAAQGPNGTEEFCLVTSTAKLESTRCSSTAKYSDIQK